MTYIPTVYTNEDNNCHAYWQDGNHIIHTVNGQQTECLRLEDAPEWLHHYLCDRPG